MSAWSRSISRGFEMKRPAAKRYDLSSIARAWRVSERAVLDAAAILGYRFVGLFIYAQREELCPGSPFFNEAKLAEQMRARMRK